MRRWEHDGTGALPQVAAITPCAGCGHPADEHWRHGANLGGCQHDCRCEHFDRWGK